MLVLNLHPIFKARRIDKPYTFLVKAGLSPHSATNMLNDSTRNIKIEHIELICEALLCEPNDIFEFIPDKNKVYADNLTLAKLKIAPEDSSYLDTFFKMTFSELKEQARVVAKKTQE